MQNAVALIVVLVALVPGVWWASYTRLVSARADIDHGWADVDTELLRRYELVTHLIEAPPATSDPALVDELIRRREDAVASARTAEAANEYEPPLSHAIDQLVRPTLHEPLAAADDRIAVAGSFYNTRVEQLDRRIDAFASGFVADRHGFERATFFEW